MRELGGYRLDAKIAEGRFSTIWRARHVVTGWPAAVKVLRRSNCTGEYERAVTREVRACAGLAHRGVVEVYEVGHVPPAEHEDLARFGRPGEAVQPGSLWIATQLAEHGALDPLSITAWPDLRRLLLELLGTLAHVHANGVVHRDIRPENILIDGPDRRPLLADFAAAQLDRGRAFTTTPVTGDPRYLAPEQILGAWRDHGPATDLYALGCVAYEIASGRTPFSGIRSPWPTPS